MDVGLFNDGNKVRVFEKLSNPLLRCYYSFLKICSV